MVDAASVVVEVRATLRSVLKIVDVAENTVPTTEYVFFLLMNLAQTSGSDGRMLKRPTPVSQQSVVWSQQYDVSLAVELKHDIRSVPPVEAPSSPSETSRVVYFQVHIPRQRPAHSGACQF